MGGLERLEWTCALVVSQKWVGALIGWIGAAEIAFLLCGDLDFLGKLELPHSLRCVFYHARVASGPAFLFRGAVAVHCFSGVFSLNSHG